MSMVQDNDGFLWFSTWDGINKFDGYDFKVYKTRQGNKIPLSTNRVDVLKVDKFNFIWLITYDNRVYRLNQKSETFEAIPMEINGDIIKCSHIKVLPNGVVWILAQEEGAIRVTTNPHNYKMSYQSYALHQKNGGNAHVRDVITDIKNNEWLITDNGLVKVDGKKGTVTNYFVNTYAKKKDKLQSFYTGCLVDDEILFSSSKGRVWSYSFKDDIFRLIELPLNDRIISIKRLEKDRLVFNTRLDCFIVSDLSLKNFKLYNNSNISNFPSDKITEVYVDRHGEVWFAMTEWGKICHFNPDNEKFVTEKMKVDPMGADRSFPEFGICEDINDNLWVHPQGGGLSWFDRHNNRLVPFHNDPDGTECRFSNKIHSMLADRQGNLWFCTHSKGLEKVTLYGTQFNVWLFSNKGFDLNTNTVRSLFRDEKGRLWISKRNGQIDVYSKTNEYIGFLSDNGTISRGGKPLEGVAYNIIEDKSGKIWIATKGSGVVMIEFKDDIHYSFTRFEYDPDNIYSLSHNSTYYLHEDSYGRIWVATFGGGLNYITKDKDGKYIFINNRNNLKGYPIDRCYRVRHINQDKRGNIWVGTADGAICFKENFKSPESIVFHLFNNEPGKLDCISNNNIYEIVVTRKGETYFATFGGGLNRLKSLDDRYNASFENYTTKDGLPSDILLSVEEDGKGSLWISSENGLCRFIPSKKRFENYNERDFGYKVRFEEGASVNINNNTIMFGTGNGVISFNPNKISKSDFIPPIVFSELKVGNQIVIPSTDNKILKENINTAEEIILSPGQNIFSLSFAALGMINSENIKYAYYLEDFDKEWNYVGKQRSAIYTNLSPGTYYLHVKSTNSDGVWVNNERTLKVVILPSFWETPIAIIMYVVATGLLIFIAVYILFTIYRLKHEVSVEQQISDIKLRFFTNISHELRTPLTLISGPLEVVMKNKNISEDVRAQLQVVERNTDRMLRLVNQILDFRKIQKKKMKLRLENINIVPFVHQIMNNFQSLAEDHQIDFIFESEKSDIRLWIDNDKLEKIVFNLLSNAFKYTPSGKMIKLFIHENENNVAIGVQDQGIGISEKNKASLFVRFENILEKNLFNQQSSGIGLSLVKELVDLHKGTIKVDSKIGEGSTFIVEILKGREQYYDNAEFILSDIQESSTIKIETAKSEDSSFINDETRSDYKTMLLVEDNLELRFFLRSIFSLQYNVIEATNGMEGLNKALKFVPDMIISDIMMPEMDGMEMIRQIRENMSTSHIPVVLLTAKTDMDSKLEGMSYGADDYITKPFSATYLQARVENIMERRSKLQHIYCEHLMTIDDTLHNHNDEEKEPQLSANDRKFMDKLTELMEKNMDNGDLLVDDIVSELAVSRSVFFKKLKTLTGLSPIEFIKEMRVKRAAQLIETGEYNMTQISYMVGINDPRYFSKCFKNKYGITPTEYKEKVKTNK